MRITRELLERANDLQDRKRELESMARQIGSELAAILDDLTQALIDSGKRRVERGDCFVELTEGVARVSWKQEFIRIAGSEKAAELVANAPRPLKAKVGRVKSAAQLKAA